jgi:hypothetical protein
MPLNVGWLGVFIASITKSGRWKAAVAWRTGQSGAPPDTVRCASHVSRPLGSDRWSSDWWVGMAILPAGSGIHGYPIRWFRVRVRNLTRGSHPYPTRDKNRVGYGFNILPAGPGGYPKFSLFIFQPTAGPISFIQSPRNQTLVSLSPYAVTHELTTTSRQKAETEPRRVTPPQPSTPPRAEAAAQYAANAAEEAIWEMMLAEASKMQASARAEELDVLRGLVAPVEAELETEHTLMQQRYEQAVAAAPNNSLILANFAQFRLAVLLLPRSLPQAPGRHRHSASEEPRSEIQATRRVRQCPDRPAP